MATDVRSLLRQQQAARRIQHPLAHYSDSGKLSCTACVEVVKSEALWDGHLRSSGHRQKVQALTAANKASEAPNPPSKRKLESDDESDEDDAVRRKRSRGDMGAVANGAAERDGDKDAKDYTL